MAIDRSSNPYYLNDFLTYTKVIKIRSDRTVEAYYNDIKLFLKYLKRLRTNMPADTKLESVSIKDIPIDMLKDITLSDIYDFLYFASEDLKNNDRTRARKSSSLRAFFKYLSKQAHLLDSDPLKDLEMPSIKQKLPKYLTLDDSVNLLEAVADSEDKYFERDYCIITLFINCGMRLSELVGINLRDINMDERTLRLLGKGNKERIIYINNACVDAVSAYLKVRPNSEAEPNALFLSKRGTRISRRRVQQVVENALKISGLDNRGLSTHKLRHTAATLMYQYGNVDTLVLKDILGHKSIATTEIYTHISNENLKNAIDASPLANITAGGDNGNDDKDMDDKN